MAKDKQEKIKKAALPLLVVKGFCMGTADVIPGVSGATMAFILGIYQRLLAAIRSFDTVWLKALLTCDSKTVFGKPDFTFLIPLLIGIVAAFAVFTRIIPLPQLVTSHPEQVYGLFFGLIGGSVYVIFREMGKVSLRDLSFIAAGTVFGLAVTNTVPVQTPETSWFIFLCGFIAITAMLVPGISGSFILLILGKYAYIFDSIGTLNFKVLLPFALGALAGLIAFSRILLWLIGHYYRRTLAFIKGLLLGSLWSIWPFQERTYVLVREKERLIASTPILPVELGQDTVLSLSLMALGLLAVAVIHHIADKKHHMGKTVQ